jgi:hypothetical protein
MLNLTNWVHLLVTVSRYQGGEMTDSTEYSKGVKKLMRMTKNIKRTRTQPLWNPADENSQANQQRKSFSKIPSRPNLSACATPAQLVNAMEYGHHSGDTKLSEDTTTKSPHVVAAATSVE